ncbi:hypothetical protein CBS101457_005364 [Exobasidium rhododendri]|nr:hypothetical protein CBS101457_005364 [Exobasidium rhododendri]
MSVRLRGAAPAWQSFWRERSLTLFAKTVVILVAEVAFNALIWIIAVIVFTRSRAGQGKVLGLALIAWTTGLRHGLDADHISAIDNATRRIVSVPVLDHQGRPRLRRPVTVGLFFSLGHSTIVVVTIIAIAISAKIANNLNSYGNVGSIIGASVSGSFLLLIGCINTVILYRTWTRLKSLERHQTEANKGVIEERSQSTRSHPQFNGLMTRMAMPLLRTVDRPWKLYPVGLLFGLGFDTAGSIALLSVAVIAQQDGGGSRASNGNVVLLAFLFTAGMTLVDSIDSCLMIWAYAPDLAHDGRKKMALWESHTIGDAFEDTEDQREVSDEIQVLASLENTTRAEAIIDEKQDDQVKEAAAALAEECLATNLDVDLKVGDEETPPTDQIIPSNSSDGKMGTLDESASRLSLVLTFLSILIAFAIGIIVLLGLIGDQCARCTRAADQEDTDGRGGLEGRWWLAWRRANDNSGYVGAGIVGLFAISVGGYFAFRWLQKKKRRMAQR